MAASSTLYEDEYPPIMEDHGSTEKFLLTPVVSSSPSPYDDDNDDNSNMNRQGNNNNNNNNNLLTAMKLLVATALFYSAGTSFAETYHQMNNNNGNYVSSPAYNNMPAPTMNQRKYANGSPSAQNGGRRLSEISKKNPPSYMKELMKDLEARTKLMTETPPEEVKYWFEYTGPLQVCVLSSLSFFYNCVIFDIIFVCVLNWLGGGLDGLVIYEYMCLSWWFE